MDSLEAGTNPSALLVKNDNETSKIAVTALRKEDTMVVALEFQWQWIKVTVSVY
jgi:hypothetical protein